MAIAVGELVESPSNVPDDYSLDAAAVFVAGPTGTKFGYMSHTGAFVFQGDDTNVSAETATFFSFPYTAGADLAVLVGEDVYSLSNGSGTFTLSNPNPDNPSVFLSAALSFVTPQGQANLSLNAMTVNRHTGGFYSNAPPAPILGPWGAVVMILFVLTIGTYLVLRRARRSAA